MFIKNRVNKIRDSCQDRQKLKKGEGGGRQYLNQAMDMMDRHSKIARMVKGIIVTRKSGDRVSNIMGHQERFAQRMHGNHYMPYSDYVSIDFGEDESYRPNKDLRRYFNISNEVSVQEGNQDTNKRL